MKAFLLIVSIIVIYLMVLIVEIVVFGWYISKEKAKKFMNISLDSIWLNSLNRNIISSFNGYFIAHTITGLLSKYYIDGYGLVWRWSKLHHKINEYFIHLNKLP